MTDAPSEIQKLYQTFLTCWNARDFGGVAACFSEPATYVLPDGVVPVPDRKAMISLLEKVFAGLESDGFSQTTIGAINVRMAGENMAVIDARDVARLRGNGSAIEVIDGHYIAHRTDGKWRFAVAVTCDRGWQDA